MRLKSAGVIGPIIAPVIGPALGWAVQLDPELTALGFSD
jgi:hypothetical protein